MLFFYSISIGNLEKSQVGFFTVIAFNGVSYFFSKEIGVKDVNFEISQDEFAFLIGPTGSGKTTIMRLIYMDLMPDEGFVTVGGISSNKIKKRKIPMVRRKIGMVFQEYHLLSDRNIFENVALPLHMVGIRRDEVRERVMNMLNELDLEEKEKKKPFELSGGEQQRVCIARALVKEPEVILADEPTGNLDPVAAHDLIKLLENVNNEGTAVFMVSHNYNLIKNRGHRILEIQMGEIQNQ